MSFISNLQDKLKRHKTEEDVDMDGSLYEDDLEPREAVNHSEKEDDIDDLIELKDDDLEENNVSKFNKRRIGAAAAVTVFALSGIYGYAKSSGGGLNTSNKTDPPVSIQEQVDKNKGPAAGMPENYSDIQKMTEKQQKENQQKQMASQPRPQQPATITRTNTMPPRTMDTYASTPVMATTTAANNEAAQKEKEQQQAAEAAIKEQQKIAMSPIAFKIAADVSSGANKSGDAVNTQDATSTSTGAQDTNSAAVFNTNDGSLAPRYLDDYASQYGSDETGQYILQAGSVINATLITGISTDIPNNIVTATVRSNVYDSRTHSHLLIPQGSKIIGQVGNQGGKGVKRISVIWTRIILPDGQSIMLPKLPTVDGTGMPGMKDKYDQHMNNLFKTTFATALVGAMAQAGTGGTSGDDTRSPGQESISGAVAQFQNAASALIGQAANQQATIEIRPGKDFNIFVTQDLSIGQYNGL